MDVIVDFGNARWKWFNPRTNDYGDLRHAIAPIPEGEWNDIVGRSHTPPEGYALVNGSPFAFGDAARRFVIKERPQGAARYVRDYYGVGVAYCSALAMKRPTKSVTLFASHSPFDIKYTSQLTASIQGNWRVQCHHGDIQLGITQVNTFDEPLGGYSHFVFTAKGVEQKKNPLSNQTTLVIDVGGYTVDVVAVDPGGKIDLRSPKSTRTGVINMLEAFERDLRHNNAELFQDTGDLDVRRVENALLEGKYKFGRIIIDCEREAIAAINTLVNDVRQVINAAGGAANYDAMLLTGGGAALIYDSLVSALPRVEFILAEPDRDLMKFSNVFGGAKLAALLRNLGVL